MSNRNNFVIAVLNKNKKKFSYLNIFIKNIE